MSRHRLDLFSLLSGLTLIAIAVVALAGISLDVARWVGPSVLIGIGVLILATVLSPNRDGSGEAPPEAAAAPGSGPASAPAAVADSRADDAGADDIPDHHTG